VRSLLVFVASVWCIINCDFVVVAADEESQDDVEDSSAGLPDNYAKDYLVAHSTLSPDKKFAIIYHSRKGRQNPSTLIT
jgi:hypothetical protein